MTVDDAAGRELLEALVATPSPSGQERAATAVLVEHLSAWGLGPTVDEVGNVLVSRGADPADGVPHVVQLGHIDTFPGEPEVHWDEDVLWGRGTVDAKGPLVAHALALARLTGEALDQARFTLIAAVGEEATSPGARHLAGSLTPDALLISEPTGLATVGLGYKGCMKGRITCTRELAHAASDVPTAAEVLLDAVDRLTAWSENPERLADFDRTTVRVVELSHETDGIVDTATAGLDVRLPGPVPDRAELEALLPEGVEMGFNEAWPAVRSARSDPVATALRGGLLARGHEPRTVVKTGTSDWNVVASLGWTCPGAAYGPGDGSLDHTPQERIALADVLEAARVLEDGLQRLPTTLLKRRREAAPGAERPTSR